MKILCNDQYDFTWWQLRRGKPTSSNVAKIVTPAKQKYSSQAEAYIHNLIGELYDPLYPRTDGPQTSAMKNGTEGESPARKWFELETSMKVNEVGLCVDDDELLWGSPDGIADTGEPVEIKCPTPGVHVGYLLDGTLPTAYIGQLHAHMLVAGTKSAWFISYCDGFEALIIHVQASDYLDALRDAMPKFHAEYRKAFDTIVEKQGPPPVVELVEEPEEETIIF